MIDYIRQVLETYFTLNDIPELGEIMYFSFVDANDSQEDWIEYDGYFKFSRNIDTDIYNAIREQFPHIKKITAVFGIAHKFPKNLEIFTSRFIPVFTG